MIRIKINDLPVTCFDYDTDQSISDRFAVMLQTLPKWIDPISVKSIKNGDDMKINVFKNDMNSGIKLYDKDFTKFIDSIKERLYFENISFDIILKYWLSELYKSKPFISNDIGMIELEMSLESYKAYIMDTFRKDKIYTFIDEFFKYEMKNFIKDIDKRVKKVKSRSESLTKKFTEIEKMPIIPYKDFAKENIAVKIKLPITRMEMSIQTVFANLECYQDTPFFTFDGMYKFYNDLEHPLPEWDSILNAVIIGYIYTLDHSAPYQHVASSYSRCFITYEEDDRLTIYIEINYTSSYNQKLYKDTVLSRFFKCFKHNYEIYGNMEKIEIDDERIVGIAIFPMLAFNTIIMSDMIMNNSLFSHFLVVDEREQASKEKSGLYTHFFIESDEGKASIMTRIASKELQEIKHIDRQSLPYGAPYIRVRITQSKNMTMVNRFLSIFSQLLGLYNKYEDKVIADYKTYGVSVDKRDDYDIQTSFSLSQLVPEMFHPKYTRSCGSERQPLVITEDETKNYEPHQYLKFPSTPEEGEQFIYACATEKNIADNQIYAGLILNKSKTKDKYPYIPCCFSDDQLNKNSLLKAYLTKSEKNVKKIQQNVITTDKFANNNYHADLHLSLADLFTVLESSEYVKKQYKYLRLGVSETRLSFLECVLKATFSDDSKYNLNEEYEKLLTYPFLSVVSQENPNETEKELYDKLKNTHYLDPRRWVRLLEEVYQCKIVVFTRDREKNEPVMMMPFHKINHLSYRSPYQTIIAIYEHFGGEATQLEDFPRCELIVAQKKENDDIVYNYFLNARTNLVDFQHHTYKQLYYHIPTQTLNPIHINYTYNDILNAFKIDGNKNNTYEQFIDSYGKTRAIIVNGISFFTSPLPPMALKTYYVPNLTPHHYERVKKYIEPHSIQTIYHNKEDNIVEITFEVTLLNDIRQLFTVKIDSYPLKSSSHSIHSIQLYPSNESNEITSFFNKKRLVVFLLEYFLYFYSSYCNNLNIRENSIKNTSILQNFVKNKIVVKENNEYKIPTTPLVSMNELLAHHFIDKQQNFIVDSKETKRRLVYALHIKLSTHFTQIYTYYMQSEINNFYVDTIHYNNYPSQSTVTNHIDIFDKIDRRIYESIQLSDKKYFFENKIVSSRPMLLIKKEDREHAAEISYEWNQTHRIPNVDTKHGKYSIKEDIYLYESSNKIKPYKTYDDGYANSEILAYKKDRHVNYLAIAKL